MKKSDIKHFEAIILDLEHQLNDKSKKR